jgi:hypothetical protein
LKVRDEIEQLLDDDGDMAEMYLTQKYLAQLEGSPRSSQGHSNPMSPRHFERGMEGETTDLNKMPIFEHTTKQNFEADIDRYAL